MMKNNSVLIIDYGNSYIKAGLYDTDMDKFIEIETCEKTINPRVLLTKFRSLHNHLPTKIIEASSARSSYSDPFNKELEKLFHTKIILINQFDFKGILDLSNISKDVIIGPDILAAAYYLLRNSKSKDGAVFCFGTVYFAIILKDQKPVNCLFVPSITKGLDLISNDTTIVRDFIPRTFNKEVGLNTFDAFSAGANVIMEGFVDEVIKKNGIKPEDVIITGGDAFKFANINKKYKKIDFLILTALSQLMKEKGW